MILKEFLSDWTEVEVACFYLAKCLGIIAQDANLDDVAYALDRGSLGDALNESLWELVRAKVLVTSDSGEKVKWNEMFCLK